MEYTNELDITYKTELFRNLFKKIKGIKQNENEITFYVRDINNQENNDFIIEMYPYLRRHFKLPHHTRVPKKLTSQALLSMFKECNFDYNKSTQAYYVNRYDEEKPLKTTSGFYRVNVCF